MKTSSKKQKHAFVQTTHVRLLQRHLDLHEWSHPRQSYLFQVSSKFVSESGGSFSLLWLLAFTTACITV